MPTAHSVRKILERQAIGASAPCRIDSGGTWDIKALALPLEKCEPVTLNIALDLRTRVTLSPFDDGWTKVESKGFTRSEQYFNEKLRFDTRFGLFFAAISYFAFHGIRVTIRSGSPVKSALGGSSTAIVALIKALSKLNERLGKKKMSAREILHLGYHLEDAVSSGKCGMQDQAAAVYGGVNRWFWRFGARRTPLIREPLMDARAVRALSKAILIAYSGKSHISQRINRIWINDFLAGKTRAGWIEVNEIVDRLSLAVKQGNWDDAARLLKNEMTIRREITPDALIPLTENLIDQAERAGCGARFTGAGAGGSVWAIGKPDRIERLRSSWKAILGPVRGGRILDCAVDPKGVK